MAHALQLRGKPYGSYCRNYRVIAAMPLVPAMECEAGLPVGAFVCRAADVQRVREACAAAPWGLGEKVGCKVSRRQDRAAGFIPEW